mgnify:CR=1 FL=1
MKSTPRSLKYGCPEGSFCSLSMYLATIVFLTAAFFCGLAALMATLAAVLVQLRIEVGLGSAENDLLRSAGVCGAISAVTGYLARCCGRLSGIW